MGDRVSAVIKAERPIGVFDSGIGGLSVLREIRHELPSENLLYVADSAYAPYGDQTREFITGRATALVEFLESHESKAVVVACNTATGVAVEALRSKFALPIVAMEPAVKPARSKTRSGMVGVLATTQTLSSQRFSSLVRRHAADVQVLVQPCPGLVERVEAGDLSSATTRSLVEQYLRPLLDKGADTIVLGCTHYAFLSEVIHEIVGAGVTIIDPAVAVARELRRRLRVSGLLRPDSGEGLDEFWTTGQPDHASAVISQLWKKDVEVQAIPVAT